MLISSNTTCTDAVGIIFDQYLGTLWPWSGWHLKLTITKPFLPVTSRTRCQFSPYKIWSLSPLTSAPATPLFLLSGQGACLLFLDRCEIRFCVRVFAFIALLLAVLSLCSSASSFTLHLYGSWPVSFPRRWNGAFSGLSSLAYLKISAASLVLPVPLPCFIYFFLIHSYHYPTHFLIYLVHCLTPPTRR